MELFIYTGKIYTQNLAYHETALRLAKQFKIKIKIKRNGKTPT